MSYIEQLGEFQKRLASIIARKGSHVEQY